ncbi:MAG TPA: DegT/DnrJ/EryC1/StrS family aminotransferase [Actinomycetales bacterium]|nr:DegT/DnrJ/EryC1/StrS family aminotransferase [Actinomycetales bacterium]
MTATTSSSTNTGTARPLAVLGGSPTFPDGLPLVRPWIPDPAQLAKELQGVLESGRLTNGPLVRRLEEAVEARLGVRHAVAVSSCTAGLMLVYQALGVRGPVVMPSFTFAASAHAVRWAGGTPAWADVDAHRLTLDPADAARVIHGAAAISATHVYGAPCQIETLAALAADAGVPLVFDAAHALGSVHRGRPVGGFGTAEVFSLSPTKVTVAGEGGIVTTDDDRLAENLRLGRDYGNPGDYDCRFVGLNARMSELHACVALDGLARIDEAVARRQELVREFKSAVEGVPGLSFQQVDDHDLSTYKDLTLVIDEEAYGLDVPMVAEGLRAEGVDSRRYYWPPIHRQTAYRDVLADRPLPVTDRVAPRVLTPPLWTHMTTDQVRSLADCVVRLHEDADVVRATLPSPTA